MCTRRGDMRISQKPDESSRSQHFQAKCVNISAVPSFVDVLLHFILLDRGLNVVIFMCNVIAVQTRSLAPSANISTTIMPFFCVQYTYISYGMPRSSIRRHYFHSRVHLLLLTCPPSISLFPIKGASNEELCNRIILQ